MPKIFTGFFLFLACLVWVRETPAVDEVKVAFSFRKMPGGDCQMALTRDSVGLLETDSTLGALEPDDENDFSAAVKKRSLSPQERDSAQLLLSIADQWKGLKRFNCEKDDGYGFSLWSDSLALHCNSCFSCTEGVSMQEAKVLARFGKLTLWLFRMRDSLAVR